MGAPAKTRHFSVRWIRSYMSVIIIIASILLCYSVLIVVQIKQDADRNNRHLAEYYNTSLENSLKAFQDFSNTLIHSNTAERLHNCAKDSILTIEELENAYDLVYDIRNYCMPNGVWDDIYIYYPEADLVIGRNGSFSSYNYFKTENVSMQPLTEEYHQWLETIFAKRKTGFYTEIDTEGQGSIYFYRDIPYCGDESNNRILVARVSRELLNHSFHDFLMSEQYQYVALIDATGHIYGEAGNRSNFVDDDGQFNFWNSDNNFVVYKAASNAWMLSFVSIQDYGTAFKTVRTISVISAAGIVAALLAGSIALFCYAAKRKKAMDQIVCRFDSVPSFNTANEFEFIGKEIDKLIQANQQALDAADRQQKIISSFFLQELLRQENCTEKDVELIGSMFDVNMENPQFSLVAVWPKSKKNVEKINKDSVIQFISEVEKDSFSVYWTEIDQIEVFLCNYESQTRSPQGSVVEFAKQIRANWDDSYEIQISPVMNSSAEISSAWQQMYQQIVPSATAAAGSVVSDEDVILLREFTDAIDNEDLTTAIRLVPDLNRQLIIGHNPNLTLCRKYCLIAKLYEHFDIEPLRRQIDSLMQAITQDNWSQQLTNLLQSLDQDINQPIDMRQVAEMAMDIIQREYNNPQLSLHMMAERIGISQSYLSRLFKQKYTVGVIQYLNYVRIEQAKKLIMQGNDNLKVIALNVGFLSDMNLIRVFKKYENTTPGNYRNMN